MSKRHQSSRRKSYGRRQHELHERTSRQPREGFDVAIDIVDDELEIEEPVYLGFTGRGGRLGIALTD